MINRKLYQDVFCFFNLLSAEVQISKQMFLVQQRFHVLSVHSRTTITTFLLNIWQVIITAFKCMQNLPFFAHKWGLKSLIPRYNAALKFCLFFCSKLSGFAVENLWKVLPDLTAFFVHLICALQKYPRI